MIICGEASEVVLVREAPHFAAYRAVNTVCADGNPALKDLPRVSDDFDNICDLFSFGDAFAGENLGLVPKVVVEDLD